MFKWYRSVPFWLRITSNSSFHTKALTAFCLSAASLLPIGGAPLARGEESSAPAAAPEESLLVATHEAAASDSSRSDKATQNSNDSEASDAEALEPVAQSSDITPELATSGDSSNEENNLQFGSSSAEADQSQEADAAKSMRRGPSVKTSEYPAEPVKFQGILVGRSTKQELIEMWGEPAETVATAEGNVLAFDIDPFQAVEVLIGEGETVAAIKVALASPLDPVQLAEQLSLSEIRSVTALDEEDEPLGQAFPERGVIFMYQVSDFDALAADGQVKPAVSHVVLQRLDPLAFVMRAEKSLHGNYSQNIKDLKTAIELDSKCAHAHCLLAKIYLATGQADLADKSATTACELDPDNASYQLDRGRTQEMLGEYDNAVLTVRAVLDREENAPIDKAQALYQIGCLASLGDVEIASKAIGFQTRAIEIADSVAASANGRERRAAKQILVEAHMAVAEEVARQAFNALRVEHVRRETENAMEYGNKAVELLAAGAASRQAVHSSEQLIGLLYFQIGAVQAVHQLDHVKAAQWYDKAEPLLAGPRPKSELYAPRREGEMLVSMGVTYWQLGEQNRALTLTQNGVNLVESAVEAGILAKSTLSVPYGNLATMYQKLGENSNAAKYSELAKTVASSDPPRVGQAEDIRQTSGAMKSSAQRPKKRVAPR